jgi:glycine cleavage system pyridoxal-binding protein P
MGVASGSVYDGATALAEAALITARQTDRAPVVARFMGQMYKLSHRSVNQGYPGAP